MPIVLGLDIGTTTITALAVDVVSGEVAARATAPHDAEVTTGPGKQRGYCEWDASKTIEVSCQCLRDAGRQLGDRRQDLAGIGLTGQQHGLLLVDRANRPQGPFINWQDRRAEEADDRNGNSFLQQARLLAGAESRQRTGCTLSAGYMGVTLFWLKAKGLLPAESTACFIPDYVAAVLAGCTPVTDPTLAASSGLFDVRLNCWDRELMAALSLTSVLSLKCARPEHRSAG